MNRGTSEPVLLRASAARQLFDCRHRRAASRPPTRRRPLGLLVLVCHGGRRAAFLSHALTDPRHEGGVICAPAICPLLPAVGSSLPWPETCLGTTEVRLLLIAADRAHSEARTEVAPGSTAPPPGPC